MENRTGQRTGWPAARTQEGPQLVPTGSSEVGGSHRVILGQGHLIATSPWTGYILVMASHGGQAALEGSTDWRWHSSVPGKPQGGIN